MMTLHHELIYAKGVLEERPMLSIVVAVLKQLVYYHVEEFLEDDSLISEHIQRLLFEYGIVGMIGGWFDGMMKK